MTTCIKDICEIIKEYKEEVSTTVILGSPFVYCFDNMVNQNEDIKEINTLDAFKLELKGCSTKDGIVSYIWISLTPEETPIVVGATRFDSQTKGNYGDFFKKYSIGICKTAREILNNIDEEYAQKNFELIKELAEKINSFSKKGIIIPINLSTISFSEDKATFFEIVNSVETGIGDSIIESGIKILNEKSHKYKYYR